MSTIIPLLSVQQFNSMINNTITYLKNNRIVLLAFLPPILLLLILFRFGVNVPFWDQWEFVVIWQKFHQGTLGFADFWVQHNEHRILLPRILMFLSGLATNWNVKFELYISFIISLASFLLIIKLLQNSAVLVKNKGTILLVSISFLFFSLVQYGNWLWGWQIQWFLSVFGLLLVIWSLYRYKIENIYFLLAIAGGFIATYSLGNGLLAFGVGVALLLMLNKKRLAFLYALISIPVIGIHFIGYHRPEQSISIKYTVLHIHEFIDYVFTYLGGSMSPNLESAKYTGVIILCMFVASIILVYQRKTTLLKMYPWLVLAGYAILSAVITGMSRLTFGGATQAYSSRYTTISILFVIGTVVSIYIAIYQSQSRSNLERYLLNIFCLIYFVLIGIGYTKSINEIRFYKNHLIQVKLCSSMQIPTSECLTSLYPVENIINERLEYIKNNRYGGYKAP